jgi:hypothetical protein
LAHTYKEPDEIRKNVDSTFAPFMGKTPYECYTMITKLREETNSEELDDDMIVVVDERSLQDDSLLLVAMPEAEDDDEESFSVRVSFELMESHLLLWGAGRTTAFEDRQRAAKTVDGVLRSEGSDTEPESISQQDNQSKEKALAKNDMDGTLQSGSAEYRLHVPDPKDFFPPELRREFLLDNGQRILLGSRDLEKNWDNEIVFMGGNKKAARVVRELFGDEKSPAFRPSKS